jgi:hypothetical protein
MQRFAFVVYVLFGALAAITALVGVGALLFAQWGFALIALVIAAVLWLMARSIGNPFQKRA